MSICVENVSYIYGKGTPFERAAVEDIERTIAYLREELKRHGINPRLAKKKTVIAKTARKQGKKRALAEAGFVIIPVQ